MMYCSVRNGVAAASVAPVVTVKAWVCVLLATASRMRLVGEVALGAPVVPPRLPGPCVWFGVRDPTGTPPPTTRAES
jgi:hypothetical protein